MPGIGVVVNPHARANRTGGGERARRLAEVLGNDGLVRVTQSREAIDEVAHEFRDRGTEVLAICGGDGSYHCTLTAFRGVYGEAPLPLLLPLRAGTINYIANGIGTRRGTAEQMLARVVQDYRHGHTYETTERDVVCVNGSEYGFVPSPRERIVRFQAMLRAHGLNATIRESRGQDIQAACGQLAAARPAA